MPYIDHVNKNNERIEIISKPLSDSIADEFSEGMAYAVGDVVMHEGGLYEFKTAHSAGAWNQNQVDAVNINERIVEIQDNVAESINEIGDINDNINKLMNVSCSLINIGDLISGKSYKKDGSISSSSVWNSTNRIKLKPKSNKILFTRPSSSNQATLDVTAAITFYRDSTISSYVSDSSIGLLNGNQYGYNWDVVEIPQDANYIGCTIWANAEEQYYVYELVDNQNLVENISSMQESIMDIDNNINDLFDGLNNCLNGNVNKQVQAISEGEDLNDYLTVGNYYIASTAIANTINNIPVKLSGRLFVLQDSGIHYFTQILLIGNSRIFLRHINESTGVFNDWKEVSMVNAVDAYASSKYFIGMSQLVENIEENEDLNNYLTPGNYKVVSSAVANTITNIPDSIAGRLYVFESVGVLAILHIYITSLGTIYYRRGNVNAKTFEKWETIATLNNINEHGISYQQSDYSMLYSRNLVGMDDNTYYPINVPVGEAIRFATSDKSIIGTDATGLVRFYDENKQNIGYLNVRSSLVYLIYRNNTSNTIKYLRWITPSAVEMMVTIGIESQVFVPYYYDIHSKFTPIEKRILSTATISSDPIVVTADIDYNCYYTIKMSVSHGRGLTVEACYGDVWKPLEFVNIHTGKKSYKEYQHGEYLLLNVGMATQIRCTLAPAATTYGELWLIKYGVCPTINDYVYNTSYLPDYKNQKTINLCRCFGIYDNYAYGINNYNDKIIYRYSLITDQLETVYESQYSISTAMIFDNGNILFVTASNTENKMYLLKNNLITAKHNFYDVENSLRLTPNRLFSWFNYKNVGIVSEYYSSKTPRSGYVSYITEDYGETWNTLFDLRNVVDSPSSNGAHLHSCVYDVYGKMYWACSGDSVTVDGIWYSTDKNNWYKIQSPRISMKPTVIVPMRDCVLFISDSGTVNVYKWQRVPFQDGDILYLDTVNMFVERWRGDCPIGSVGYYDPKMNITFFGYDINDNVTPGYSGDLLKQSNVFVTDGFNVKEIYKSNTTVGCLGVYGNDEYLIVAQRTQSIVIKRESFINIDKTLSVEGRAADAKVVGDKFDEINSDLDLKLNAPTESGINGQTLRSKGNGETEWADFGLPSDEQTQTAISSWLDEHPEAITSVADNSITSKKFHGNIPFYNVVDYGIVPNSNEDQYDAIQDLLVNYVYNTGGIVYFPKGKYITSYTIFIPENTTFLGAGVDTEIYFDESDRYFGTALSNAGSNVTIKNMKVSQVTTGMFHAGAQPGCIGFSDIAKEQVLKRNEHSVVRDNVYNLVAENLYFGGFYAIQTENSASGFIRNVTYRNLYCPDSCVSIMANNFIENVVVENIHCDLLRAWDTATNDYRVYMNNVLVNNVYFQKCYIFTNPRFETNITFNNLKQTGLERKNDRTAASNCGVVSGNVEFNNCTFTAIEAEINGLYLQNGIRKFNNCIFDMQAKITTRGASLNDNNDYDVFNNCTFISKEVPSGYLMIGYGRNNTYCDGIRNLIWGDMHKTYQTPVASPDTDIVNYLCVNETSLKLLVHFNVSSTEHLFKLSSKFNNLDISNNVFPVTLWNTQTGLIVFTFAKIENGYCDIADAEYAGLNEFDCGTIDTELMLNERPSITAIYQLFS